MERTRPPIEPARDLAAERSRALALLRAAQRPLLVGHVRPDGDCAGSELALASVLTRLGKEVAIENPDPLPPELDYLGREFRFRVHKGGALPAHDVAVFLDFCELDRTGDLAPKLRGAPSKKLVVDHHLFAGTPWWDEAYVDPRSAATGLIVRRIARELGVELDRTAAIGVFTSLVADTGWFKYSNTDAETFAVASELVALGVAPSELYASIFQRAASSQPFGLARALARLRYEAGGRIAVVDLPKAGPGEADLADSDDLLDLLRSVARVEVVLFLRELDDGKVKLSARSKTGYDVCALARGFGGGGHAKAAGATLDGPLEAARARLVAAALEALARSDRRTA
jgi:phosphoesterase RecJ-like protein